MIIPYVSFLDEYKFQAQMLILGFKALWSEPGEEHAIRLILDALRK